MLKSLKLTLAGAASLTSVLSPLVASSAWADAPMCRVEIHIVCR